jgi:ABC-2 type transport system permease protein
VIALPSLRMHPGSIAIIRATIRLTYAYRARIVLWVLRQIMLLYLMRMVWLSVYDGRNEVDGIAAGMLIVYLTVAMLQGVMIQPVIGEEIEERIMRGTVATDMVRPLSFLRQMAAIEVGVMISRIPFAMIALPLAALVGSLRLPPTPGAIAGYLLSIVLAYLITVLVWMNVGLGAFWLTSIQGLAFLLGNVQGFLSGALVPLWFLPDAVRTALELLPFQAMTFLPLSIYIGQTTGASILGALAIQAFWVVVLTLLTIWVWGRAHRRLVVQGG